MADEGHIGTILSAIEAALAVDVGDFDFSASGAVKRGTYEIVPQGSFIAVGQPEIRSSMGPQLSQYERRVELLIVACAPAEAADADTHAGVSLALLHQVTKRLETVRADNTNVLYTLREFEVQAGTLDPAIDGCPLGFAVAYLSLSFSYRNPSSQAGL